MVSSQVFTREEPRIRVLMGPPEITTARQSGECRSVDLVTGETGGSRETGFGRADERINKGWWLHFDKSILQSLVELLRIR